jgi:peptidoglycan/xylan/chitin deacetylase (PgdA/CDA1 family)
MLMNRTHFTGLFAVAALLCTAQYASAQAAPPPTPPLKVAFTFDDLPAHGSLPPGEDRLSVAKSVLETLKREKMPPVFGFVNAKRVEEVPQTIEVLRLWHSYGEPLGSHTFSHIDLDAVTTEAFEADNAKNEATLHEVAGAQNWHMFRYPYLHEGDTLAKRQEVQRYLKANGYQVAEVTLDFGDYLWNEPYARCSAKKDDASIAELEKTYLVTADHSITAFRESTHILYGHDIPYVLLMHIGAFDARMLPRLIALLRERGFTFTTIEEAEKDPAYAIDPAIGRKGGSSLQDLLAASRQVKLPPNPKPDRQLDAMCR